MNRYNVHLTLRGPNGNTAVVPNEANPIEAVDVRSLLTRLAESLVTLHPSLGIEIVGVRIERSDLEGKL